MATSSLTTLLTSFTNTATSSPSLFPPHSLPSKFSLSPLSLKLNHHPSILKPILSSPSPPSSTRISATIAVGDTLPDSTFSFLDESGEVQTTTVSDLTKGKKAIIFAVPGAFTPTCSQKHVPGFVEKSSELKAKGVDTIACIAVNDAFVLSAWKKDLNVNDEILVLSDGNGDFTKAIGVELDLSDKPVGLGVRSRRFSLLAEDGVVKFFNLEEGGAFTNSGAEDLLKLL